MMMKAKKIQRFNQEKKSKSISKLKGRKELRSIRTLIHEQKECHNKTISMHRLKMAAC